MVEEPLPPIEASIAIAAPRAAVWEVLTGKKTTPRWLGCLKYKPKLGHVFYMQPDPAKRAARNTSGATHCEVVEMAAPERFAFSWYLPGSPITVVTISLAETAGGTEAALVHAGWEQFPADAMAAIRDGLEEGWSHNVLPALRLEVEKRG